MELFKDITEILGLAWKDDDRMDQETLFDLQEKIAELALKIASREHKVDELVKKFPWAYEVSDK